MKREKMSTKIAIAFIILLVMLFALSLPIVAYDTYENNISDGRVLALNNNQPNTSDVIAATPNENNSVDVDNVLSKKSADKDKEPEIKKDKNLKKSKQKQKKRKLPKKKRYTKEDYELLARVIFGESGYYSDKLQRGVGSVVLNRVKDKRFPNTIREVLYQKNQYACIGSKYWNMKPNKSSYKNARFLLENGSQLPEYVIFQANFKQGDSVHSFFERTYFSYYMKDKKEYQKRVLIKKINKRRKSGRKRGKKTWKIS